jgi:four helix bundle protein
MSGARRFEELIAWQYARKLVRHVYEHTGNGALAKDFGLKGQLQRAAVSIMSNIAEGFERRRDKQFAYFLSIAKASCAEVRSLLYVALDAGYLAQHEFDSLHCQADEVGRIVAGLHRFVSSSES